MEEFDVEYNWSGLNGFSVSIREILVFELGNYIIVVFFINSECSVIDIIMINEDIVLLIVIV